VADDDPWQAINWKVYAAQGTGGVFLKPSDRPGSFTLSPFPSSGQPAYYAVSFAAGDMPSCWEGLLLRPYGSADFSPPSPLLQPWTLSGDAPWLSAANAVRQNLTDTSARLVGVINQDTTPQALVLVRVSGATTVGTPLLVLKLLAGVPGKDPTMNKAAPGTAHGDN
jgi:hypothetical protein